MEVEKMTESKGHEPDSAMIELLVVGCGPGGQTISHEFFPAVQLNSGCTHRALRLTKRDVLAVPIILEEV